MLLLVFVTAIETLIKSVAQDDFDLRTSVSVFRAASIEYVLPHCLSVSLTLRSFYVVLCGVI